MTHDAPHDPRRPDLGSGEKSEPSSTVGAAPEQAEPPEPPILDQVFDGDSLYALRSAVEAHAVAAGMPQGRAEDAVICVHELATNAIRHGAGTGRARVWRLSGRLRCQVDDDGAPSAASPPPDDPTDRWPYQRGHGLWLIRCAADAVSLRSDRTGTHVVLTFALPEPGPRPPFRLTTRAVRDGTPAGRPRLILTATGDFDRKAGAELLGTATDLMADSRAELILDLRAVAYWDTAGIATLSGLQHRVEQDPAARLIVVLGESSLRERLRYAGLADRLVLVADLADLADLGDLGDGADQDGADLADGPAEPAEDTGPAR
ncbi:hypothetical protein GCM10023195_64100 [Actinoallomurus liliacearum]|uniref:STAS domain-containing protein n=1 Tax=Actinoallomurus liliacearum TaxID=1080073 RepID=A0ABP8TRM1_9ACTN